MKRTWIAMFIGLILVGPIVLFSAAGRNHQLNCIGPSPILAGVVDLEKEKRDLLALHEKDRRAHFKTDSDLLVADYPESLISVRSGKVLHVTKTETKRSLESAFKNAKYSDWDDVEPPIVKIANDASMAWMITHLRVRLTSPEANGGEKEVKFVYAGIMTYEKRDGKWIKIANVSTFE